MWSRKKERKKASLDDYYRFAHADYGPGHPPGMRQALTRQYGVPEEEANDSEAHFFGFVSTVGRPLLNRVAINYPAKTFGDPAATDVQPDILSPTLPAPLPLTKTEPEPDAIGAA